MKIIVDSREPKHIPSLLLELGVEVERRNITPGDYIVSSDCAVERKTIADFMSSLFNGRLFEQTGALREVYSKPLLILEGDVEKDLEQRKNPRAFWGALFKLQMDMGISVLPTPTSLHTADALYTLVKRFQKKKVEKISIQHKPRLMSNKDWQIYVVASLPNIGDELAGRLLDNFKSVRNVFKAKESGLKKVDGIGKLKARKIIKLLDLNC